MVKKRSLLWFWHAEHECRSSLKPHRYKDWGRVRAGGCGASFSGNVLSISAPVGSRRRNALHRRRSETPPACRPSRLDDAAVVVCDFSIDECGSASSDGRGYLLHPPPSAANSRPHRRQGVASQRVALLTTPDRHGLCRMSQSTKTRPWAALQALPLLVFYPDTLRSFTVMIQHPSIS